MKPIAAGIVPGTLVVASLMAASPAPEVLTLEQAVSIAVQGNRQVRSAELEVSKSEDELGSFRTQGLPSFKIDALVGQELEDIKVRVPAGAFGDFGATGPIPANNTEVTTPAGRKTLILGQVTQPITQLRRVNLGVRLRQSNLEVAREKLRATRQSVANSVRRAYYSILQSQTALAAAEETTNYLRELDRVVGTRVAQKVELPASGLDVKARLAQQEYDVLSLRNTLATGQEKFNQLLGRSIDVPFSLDPLPELSPYEADLEAARAAALARRADLKQARLQREQAEIDHRVKKWDFVPDLSLSYSYLSLPDVELLPKHFSSIGLLLSWEPFDWGRRRRALSESRAQIEQSEASLREAESQAAIDVGERVRRLQEARSLIEATRLAHDAARERLKITTDRYQQHAALLKEVLEDQDRLSEAGRQRDEAVLSAWTARADLDKALGED